MSFLSDSKGNMSWFDFGNVSLMESASYSLFTVFSLAAFTNFALQIPTSTSTTVSLAETAFSFSVPFLGTGVYTFSLVGLTALFLYQIYDASKRKGRSDKFQPRKWFNKIPTGLTILVGLSIITVVANAHGIAIIMDLINTNIWTQFGTVSGHSVGYYALSSQ